MRHLTPPDPHRAQPGGKLSQIQAGKKRKISDYQASHTNAASTMPSLKEDREDLAWVMCVMMMGARQLALLNKTGQVNFEINAVCRTLVEWVRNIIQNHFMPFFSSMLLLSYDRVIAGYLTRQVATTFIATCARHYAEADTPADAQTRILLDMESAPVTLQSCNLAICNALTHLADTNLILVNQLIRDQLNTPVVTMEFIASVLSNDPIDMSCASYDVLFPWLSAIVQSRPNESECIMGYLSVSKLGTMDDYNCKEAFLESYFGIAKNNYFTYLTAIRECSSKVFDLTGFLSMDQSMLDFGRFATRMGVGGDGMMQAYLQNTDSQRNTYLFMQSGQDQPQQAQPQQPRHGAMKCWVNVVQHLLITAIQGNKDLHADNMFNFGANLTEFILSRCAPVQTIPSGVMVLESFQHVHEEVIPVHVPASRNRPEYFVRTVNDTCAIETGMVLELPAMLGNHPPEDVMHLASWIQLYTILHNGTRPSVFDWLPGGYNGRPPELVVGRRYPLLGQSKEGTILLQEDHTAHIITQEITGADRGRFQALRPVLFRVWWSTLEAMELMVAPLVFRHHAVICEGPNTAPLVLIPHGDEGQFLNRTGEYLAARSETETKAIPFLDVHARLLPIGAHIYIRSAALAEHGMSSSREYVQGCLRYPEDTTHQSEMNADRSQKCKVYMSVRMRDAQTQEICTKVVGVKPELCLVPHADKRQRRDDSRRVACVANRMA